MLRFLQILDSFARHHGALILKFYYFEYFWFRIECKKDPMKSTADHRIETDFSIIHEKLDLRI